MKKSILLTLLAYSALSFSQETRVVEPIWGGNYVTSPKEWSNVVGITHSGKFLCSGYLVRENIVITAAHCVIEDEWKTKIDQNNLWGEGFKVYLGNNLLSPIKRVGVAESFRPGNYEGSDANDFGVLVLDDYVTPLEATIVPPFTKSAELESALAAATGDYDISIVGWGLTENNEIGIKKWANFAFEMLTDDVVMARSRKKDSGSCSGDSGSPAMLKDAKGNWRVIGTVVSNFANLSANCGYLPNIGRIDNALKWLTQSYSGTLKSIQSFLKFLSFGQQTAKVYNKSLLALNVPQLQVDSTPMDKGYGYFWINWGANHSRKIKVTLQNIKKVAQDHPANPSTAPSDEYAYWADMEFIGDRNFSASEEKIFKAISNCQSSVTNCSGKILSKLTYSGSLWGEYRLGDNESWGKKQLNLIWRKK